MMTYVTMSLAKLLTIICLLLLSVLSEQVQAYNYGTIFKFPPCITEPSFMNNDINVDTYQTMYNCIANITSALDPPSYYQDTPPVETFNSFQFNSMMALSELEGTVTMDMFWRIYWLDARMTMPAFWDALNVTRPLLLSDGIELSQMIRSQNPLNVWLPDLFLTTAKEFNVLDETIRIRPGGAMFWSRHVVATIQENSFQYYDYPNDMQDVNVLVESYAFQSNLMNISFTPSCTPEESQAACSTLSDGYAANCVLTLDNGVSLCVLPPVTVIDNPPGSIGRGGPFSPVWNYISNSYKINFFTPGVPAFTQASVDLTIQRESSGITYRLAFPIMLLLLLVGLSFWSESGARVDTTITILLAVSALYIVIFSSIPMLAYLTRFDYYILAMFMIIVGTVFTHQLTNRLLTKGDKHPLRLIYVRTIEFFGKVVIMPGVLFAFLYTFPEGLKPSTRAGYAFFFTILAALTILREYSGFKNGFNESIYRIRSKIENPASFNVSNLEILVYNLQCFGKFSFSKSHYHTWKRQHERRLMQEGAERELSAEGHDSVGPGLGAVRLPSRVGAASFDADGVDDEHSGEYSGGNVGTGTVDIAAMESGGVYHNTHSGLQGQGQGHGQEHGKRRASFSPSGPAVELSHFPAASHNNNNNNDSNSNKKKTWQQQQRHQGEEHGDKKEEEEEVNSDDEDTQTVNAMHNPSRQYNQQQYHARARRVSATTTNSNNNNPAAGYEL